MLVGDSQGLRDVFVGHVHQRFGRIVDLPLGIFNCHHQLARRFDTTTGLTLLTRIDRDDVVRVDFAFANKAFVGLFRRFLIIDFDKQFAPTGESRNVGDEVLALERDRIVCAALRAVPDLMTRGKFIQPKESVDEVTAWRHGQDEISQFLEDCTEPCEAVRGNGTDGNTLFTAYIAWAPQNGYVVMNKNRFLNMVDKRRRKFYDNAAAKRMYPVNLRK